MCVVQVANAFAFLTMEGKSVTNARLDTMDIQTVLVSGLHPSMSTSGSSMDYQLSACDLNADGKNVAAGFTGLVVASSHDSAEQTSSFSHSALWKPFVVVHIDLFATFHRELEHDIHMDVVRLGNHITRNRQLGN